MFTKNFKKLFSLLMVFAFVLGMIGPISITKVHADTTPYKLTLTPSMVTNEGGIGNASYLVDEQTNFVAGNPPTGDCTTNWDNDTGYSYNFPMNASIDLGANYVITGVYFFNNWGNSAYMTVSSGTPGSWTSLFTDNTIPGYGWKLHSVNSVTTRYLRLTKSDWGDMREIVVYGYPVSVPTPTPTPIPTPYRLTLTSSMVTNESNIGNTFYLVDEQANFIAGNPPTGDCLTNWDNDTGYASNFPINANIDLGANYVITGVYFFNNWGNSAYMTVSSGTPGSWTSLFTDNTIPGYGWKLHSVNSVSTRYLRLTKSDWGDMREIVIYGYPAN
jgi:hypothetical protein